MALSSRQKYVSLNQKKMGTEHNCIIVYKFYKKPMANIFTMMANSAVSSRVKRSSMTNEAVRRLLCCSTNLEEHVKVEVMEDFARMMKRSGYSERFRHEVITDALRCHQKMLEAEARGGRPVDRPRKYQEVERRWRREEKKTRYYKKHGRGTKIREGGFIIPPTPNSLLAML